ncbi:MAG: hypothetical protein ABIV63_06110 [Caldimonas sp.]
MSMIASSPPCISRRMSSRSASAGATEQERLLRSLGRRDAVQFSNGTKPEFHAGAIDSASFGLPQFQPGITLRLRVTSSRLRKVAVTSVAEAERLLDG